MVLPFESVDKITESDRSNQCYRVVFSCGAVCHAVGEILNIDHSRDSFK